MALQIVPNPAAKRCGFRIIERRGGRWFVHLDARHSAPDTPVPDPTFDGTVKRGSATCPCCGYTTPVVSVRKQLKARHGGANDARLLCVVSTRPDQTGRFYRLPIEADLAAVRRAAEELARRRAAHTGDLSLVPQEVISLNEIRRISVPVYGIERWGDLFTARQLLALTTLARLVTEAGKTMAADHAGAEFAQAVQACLALSLGRVTDLANSLCGWTLDRQCTKGLFRRQAIPMVWDFAESACTGESAGAWGHGVSSSTGSPTCCPRSQDSLGPGAANRRVRRRVHCPTTRRRRW